MILLGLFGLLLILMLAILLWPEPEIGDLDLAAYRRAGDRFSRIMTGLLLAVVLVAMTAYAWMEVLQAVREDTIPAGIERQAAPWDCRRGIR